MATNLSVNYYNIAKDFLPLIGILIAYITYVLNRHSDQTKKTEETKTKQINLIDSILIALERIDALFESLKLDARDKTYYSYANINLARPIVDRIQSILNDVIVFSDDEVKEEILKNLDMLQPLIDEVNNIEQYNTSELQKLDGSLEKKKNDLYALRLRLIEQQMELDEYNSPKFIDQKKNKDNKMVTAIFNIVQEIDRNYSEAVQRRNNSEIFIKDKRSLLVTRIIDVQTRLRELKKTLISRRKRLQRSNTWKIKLFKV